MSRSQDQPQAGSTSHVEDPIGRASETPPEPAQGVQVGHASIGTTRPTYTLRDPLGRPGTGCQTAVVAPDDTAFNLCVLLWANAGCESGLVEYEDRVLALLGDHGATVPTRARTAGAPGQPIEIHLLRFRSEAAFETYVAPERRAALAGDGRAPSP